MITAEEVYEAAQAVVEKAKKQKQIPLNCVFLGVEDILQIPGVGAGCQIKILVDGSEKGAYMLLLEGGKQDETE